MTTQEWFVGNVPFGATEAELQVFLEEHSGATVRAVRLVRHADTRESRGFGFATAAVVGSQDDMDHALFRLLGQAMAGRRLRIEPVRGERRSAREAADEREARAMDAGRLTAR